MDFVLGVSVSARPRRASRCGPLALHTARSEGKFAAPQWFAASNRTRSMSALQEYTRQSLDNDGNCTTSGCLPTSAEILHKYKTGRPCGSAGGFDRKLGSRGNRTVKLIGEMVLDKIISATRQA